MLAWKAGIPKGIAGSNPVLSATTKKHTLSGVFFGERDGKRFELAVIIKQILAIIQTRLNTNNLCLNLTQAMFTVAQATKGAVRRLLSCSLRQVKLV